jgi:hypothetical protein
MCCSAQRENLICCARPVHFDRAFICDSEAVNRAPIRASSLRTIPPGAESESFHFRKKDRPQGNTYRIPSRFVPDFSD